MRSHSAPLRLLAAIALGAAALAGPRAALAQPYPPEWVWHTIETEHFRIHFHEGVERVAAEVARAAEHAHEVLVPVIGRAPKGRTEIVVSDDVDEANGWASPVPYNTIRVYAAPPQITSELGDERAWIEGLVVHEYVHILHIDSVEGLPAVVNALFGRVWFPNGLVPSFMLEGLAVTHEAQGEPGSGRNDSALHDMYVRSMALDGGVPTLPQVSNGMLDWPTGQVPYVLGGRFMAYLDATYGSAAIAGFVKDQGGQIWPYAPSWSGERWLGGKSFAELWADWGAHERAEAERKLAEVLAGPRTPSTRLTRIGARVDNPRWSPDGSFLMAFHRGLDERSGLWRVTPDGKDLGPAALVDLNGTFAMRSPVEAVVAETEVFHEFRDVDDLFLRDLRTGDRRRLTDGERATEPDLLPDGTLVHVKRTGDGGMALVRRRLEDERVMPAEVLFEERGTEVFNPRLSPDGRRIAFTIHRNGRTDLALWEGGAVRALTDDDALDLEPAWTPDGAFVVFASDRGGAYDLYAYEIATGAVKRITHAETGALWPDVSPDGKRIAFLTYARTGYDVATIPLDPATWTDAAPIPPAPAPAMPPPLPPLDLATTRPYRALDTLGPWFWFPIFGSDAAGNVFGAVTGGADVLLRHIWAMQAWWSAGGKTPGYAFSYQGRWAYPIFDLSSSRDLTFSPDPVGRTEIAWNVASTGLTFPFDAIGRSLSLRLGWSGTIYQTFGAPPTEQPPAEYRFDDGFLSELSAALAYSDARQFVRSISPEEGRTITLSFRIAAPAIGSDFTLARTRASIAQFLRIPWTRHWVLLLRASGGVAHGTLGDSSPFTIGGPALQVDPLAYLLGALPGGDTQALRGYAPSALGGTGFYLGTVELRFPIAAPELGRNTWPIYLRRIHGSVFTDAGDAFDLPGEVPVAGYRADLAHTRFGVGAELGLEMVFGYWLRTDVRLGIARPLGPIFQGGREQDLLELGEAPAVRFYVTIVPQ